ncbi:MAG: DUF6282 family protein [Methanobacterium sp.]|nr:DUF6282 family protein [Methanobacterium sp.]
MNKLEKKYPLKGFMDTHLHTAPDIQPRLLTDLEAAEAALKEKMRAIVIKSHVEPTSGRAAITQQATGMKVFGGVCLNSNVGGLNVDAVKTAAALGGKIIWLPTISKYMFKESLEDILTIIAENDLILATGHLSVPEIFQVLDLAKSSQVKNIIINHPLTRVVGASLDEQKEMSRTAFLEHCYVACLPRHDQLDPQMIAQAIKEIGPRKCILATDLGQRHNMHPVEGFKLYINTMMEYGVSWKDIKTMCIRNPYQLFF